MHHSLPPSYEQTVLEDIEKSLFRDEESGKHYYGHGYFGSTSLPPSAPTTIAFATGGYHEDWSEPRQRETCSALWIPEGIQNSNLYVDVKGTVKIVREQEMEAHGQLVFTIRDMATDTLVLHGQVSCGQSAFVKGCDGRQLILITRRKNLYHVALINSSKTAEVEMVGGNSIHLTVEDEEHLVNKIGGRDIVISRPWSTDVIAKIVLPIYPEGFDETSDYTISFQERLVQPITELEKGLCIAVPVIHMMAELEKGACISVTIIHRREQNKPRTSRVPSPGESCVIFIIIWIFLFGAYIVYKVINNSS